MTHRLTEAVFLSQRIYVLSSNPGRVKTELSIPLPVDRDFTIKRAAAFQDLEGQLVALLREESLKQEPGVGTAW